MIQENGVVIRADDQYVWVETRRKTTCESCSVNKGCGTAILSKVVGTKVNVVQMANPDNLRLGDQVVLGLEESALVKGSFTVYMLPLLLALAFGLFGEFLRFELMSPAGEWLTILFAGLGLVCGLLWARHVLTRQHCRDQYHPVIVKRSIL